MASTSATKLLYCCLRGEPWSDELLGASLEEEDGRAFFRVVVEGLGDRFEPVLCEQYAHLFARAIELTQPGFRASDLVDRYRRVRRERHCTHHPSTVYVLSRVTLGADVAVTSIVLDAVKQRFPEASVRLVGPRKNWELFAADPRIEHVELAYPRTGSFEERIASVPRLDRHNSIVVDPDSRLSQLGMLPVCDESHYFFFESRSYGEDGDATLVELTRDWVRRTFGVNSASAYIAPLASQPGAEIVVSLGVGENQEKRIPDPFEAGLLKLLSSTGKSILIDEGAGGEETLRVQRLAAQIPGLRTWSGAYAPFAHAISKARLYVGYDSAGQHVAAACGAPLLSIFAGHHAERMYSRWRPDGRGPISVIKVTDRDPRAVLEAVRQNLTL